MKSLEQIKEIREEKRKELDLRVNLNANTVEKHILVCRRNRLYIIKIRGYNKQPKNSN